MRMYPVREKHYLASGLANQVDHITWAKAVVRAADVWYAAHIDEVRPCSCCGGCSCPECIDGFEHPDMTAADRAAIFAVAAQSFR